MAVNHTGHLLLATPELVDPNFQQTVIYIVQHDEAGAMGLVLNRPTEMMVAEALVDMDSFDEPPADLIYTGGPVDGPLMALHVGHHGNSAGKMIEMEGSSAEEQLGEDFENNTNIRKKSIILAVEPAELRQLVSEQVQPIRFFGGYAGWGAGQLDAEIQIGSWLATKSDISLVFDRDPRLWMKLLRKIDPTRATLWQNPGLIPSDPSLN